MSMKETVTLEVVRYRDDSGQPTCAVNFDTGENCEFYRTQRMGTSETCIFAPEAGKHSAAMSRREFGLGSLEPGNWCPIWKGGVV